MSGEQRALAIQQLAAAMSLDLGELSELGELSAFKVFRLPCSRAETNRGGAPVSSPTPSRKDPLSKLRHTSAHTTPKRLSYSMAPCINAPASFEGVVLAGVLGQAGRELDVMFRSEVRWVDLARVFPLGFKKSRHSAG